MLILSISIFGVSGILCRYSIDMLLKNLNQDFPYSTLLVNIVGCFILSYVCNMNQNKLPPIISQGLIVGFCGGFTTFSSFSLQILSAYHQDLHLKAILYLFASVTLGLSACLLGYKLANYN